LAEKTTAIIMTALESRYFLRINGHPRLSFEEQRNIHRVFLVPDESDPVFQGRALSSLPNYLNEIRPKYIVYSDQGVTKSVLPLSTVCRENRIRRTVLSCVFDNGVYKIFETSFGQP
jgi:hypothetical protein